MSDPGTWFAARVPRRRLVFEFPFPLKLDGATPPATVTTFDRAALRPFRDGETAPERVPAVLVTDRPLPDHGR